MGERKRVGDSPRFAPLESSHPSATMPEPRRSRRGEGGATARSEEEGKEDQAKEKEVEKKPKASAKGGKRKKAGAGGKEEDAPAGESLEREAGLEKRLAEHLQVLQPLPLSTPLIALKSLRLTFSASRRDAACDTVASLSSLPVSGHRRCIHARVRVMF